MQPGDTLKCVFTQSLPGKDVAPLLKQGNNYVLLQIHTDSGGNHHYDVGLEMEVECIYSFETKELLPSGIRWCHPNRFVKL